MEYTEEILDRKTGDLVSVSKGDWITIGELGDIFGYGRRQTTTVLRHMGFLQVEGGGRNCRHRVAPWVVQCGWGKRLKRKADGFPFDVIGPEGTAWIMERWVATTAELDKLRSHGPVSEAAAALLGFKASRLSGDLNIEGSVYWLADFFPDLTHEQVATCLYISRQLVDRYRKRRSEQIREARMQKARQYPAYLPEPVVASVQRPIRKDATPQKMTSKPETSCPLSQAA
jgi:hypothetical protein